MRDVREPLDQLELMRDLAALGLDVLLGLLEVLGGRLRLESDLLSSTSTAYCKTLEQRVRTL